MSRVLVDTREFFESPKSGEFQKLQRRVLESNDYDPSATQLQQTEISLATQSPTHALKALSELSDDYQICPRYHYVEARIRESLGEVVQMREAIARLRACIKRSSKRGKVLRNRLSKSRFSRTQTILYSPLERENATSNRC